MRLSKITFRILTFLFLMILVVTCNHGINEPTSKHQGLAQMQLFNTSTTNQIDGCEGLRKFVRQMSEKDCISNSDKRTYLDWINIYCGQLNSKPQNGNTLSNRLPADSAECGALRGFVKRMVEKKCITPSDKETYLDWINTFCQE